MKRIMSLGFGIAQTALTIALVCIAIVFVTYFGLEMAANWQGPNPGYHLIPTLQTAMSNSINFLEGLLHFDLGTTRMTAGDAEISEILWDSYLNSFGLLALAIGFASVLGILFGGFAALASQSRWEYLILMLTLIGVSAPSFLLAVILQSIGIKYTVTFGNQLVSMGGYVWDFKHLIIPVMILTARPLAQITRVTFINLNEIMGEDYIRTAYAKGLKYSRTVIIHALKNLAVSVLTAIGVSLRFSISILPVVEYIFAWPGLGRQFLEGIWEGRMDLVVAIALSLGLTIQFINYILNLLYPILDPRLRTDK
ncbi:MAG: ABC transporter permease [Anaerolineales bacterium]|nr:ABC transporter permease [Anaerolineales bacterium]